MHMLWGYLITKMIVKQLIHGKVEDDVRVDED